MKTRVFIKKLLNHQLIQGSFFVFTGGILANIANFIFNLFLTRHISYAEYGIYAAIISLVGLLSLPAQAIYPIIIRYGTLFFSKEEFGKAKYFFLQTLGILTVGGILLTLTLLIFSSFFSQFFQLGNWTYVVATGLMVTLSFIFLLVSGYIQSQLRFFLTGCITFVGGLGKVVLGIIFVLAGFGVGGTIIGLVGGYIVSISVGLIGLSSLFFHSSSKKINLSVKEFSTFSFASFLSILSITSFASSDILLVKHFFSAHDAGLYAGLALIGKIIFYFTAPIITVMLPVLMSRFHKEEKVREVLYLSIFLVFVPSLILSVVYFLFPGFIITFFLGGKAFLLMTPLVGWYGLYIAFFSACNVLISYFLTTQKISASYFTAGAALLQIAGIICFHNSIAQVVTISVGSILLLSFCLLILFINHIRNYAR